MASWGAVVALTGFQYEAASATFTMAAKPGRHFWSTGGAFGSCTITLRGAEAVVAVMVREGALAVSALVLEGHGRAAVRPARRLGAGEVVEVKIPRG
jgi:non-lysosomal glucosylceramidase